MARMEALLRRQQQASKSRFVRCIISEIDGRVLRSPSESNHPEKRQFGAIFGKAVGKAGAKAG